MKTLSQILCFFLLSACAPAKLENRVPLLYSSDAELSNLISNLQELIGVPTDTYNQLPVEYGQLSYPTISGWAYYGQRIVLDPRAKTEPWFAKLVLHEIGHMYRLGHSQDECDIMYPQVDKCSRPFEEYVDQIKKAL